MDTETLRLFCEVAEAGSFTAIARKHEISQSAVSQWFRGLEKQFNAVFAIRKPGFSLTPQGRAFYSVCRHVLRLEADAFRKIGIIHTARPRTILLAACYTAGLCQLPPALDRFRLVHPAIRVRDSYHRIPEVHELVLDHGADLGCVCYPHPHRGLVIDLLQLDRMMAIVAPQHPLATRAAVTPADLAGQTFVGWDAVHASPFLGGLPGRQRRLLHPHHQFDEVESVKCQVEGGNYIALLPEMAVQSEVADHRLAAVPFQGAGRTEPVGLIYRRNRELNPATKTFIAFLKSSESSTTACRAETK